MKNPIDLKKDKIYFIVIAVLICILGYGLISSFITNMKLNAALDAELKAYRNTYNPFPELPSEEINKHIKNIFGEFDRIADTDTLGYKYQKVYKNTILLGYAKEIQYDIKCGTCTDIRLFCGIDYDKKVKGFSLVNKINLFGEMIDGKKLFDQFMGINFKKYQDTKIKWITGATLSCKAIEGEVGKFLTMVNEYE